tara:strand:- start:543 stop:1421 length:879 start_codon:yes stop_codon:yes gene_type:complete
MPEKNFHVVEKALFHLGTGAVFHGYHDYMIRWRGWACPYFTRGEAERLVKKVHGDNGRSAWWDGDAVVIVQPGCPEMRWDPRTVLDSHHHEGRLVWAIGDHSWRWNDIQAPDVGRITAICTEDVAHATFYTPGYVREVHEVSSGGQTVSRTHTMELSQPVSVDPEKGHHIVFPSEAWLCTECGSTAVLLRGHFPCQLSADQQHDIDGVVGGKMDNSHDAGGPDLEEHEAAASVIYDCVHYIEGVIEDATCVYGLAEAKARWGDTSESEFKLRIVDYIRRRYFGLINDSLLPK